MQEKCTMRADNACAHTSPISLILEETHIVPRQFTMIDDTYRSHRSFPFFFS